MRDSGEPTSSPDLRGLLLAYLDHYRDVVVAKVAGLPAGEVRGSRLPSGWTPAGMLTHLAFMERRWFQWGFRGEPVVEPWGDRDGEGGWRAASDDVAELAHRLHREGARTREIVEAHALTDFAAVGGRFATAAEAPQLHWILLHVLQEYARHAGHLDVVRELADGSVGEDG